MRPIVRRLRSSRPLRLPDGAGATLRADGLMVALAGSNAAVGLAFAQHARRPVGPPPDDHEEVPMSSNGHEQTLEHDAAVPEALAGRVGAALEALVHGCDARGVFGEPHQAGDRVVVPVAAVLRAGGFGFGAGGDGPSGGGGGGGGSAEGRPVAAIEIGPEGVRVRPIVDLTRLGLAALATVVGLVGAVRAVRLARSRR